MGDISAILTIQKLFSKEDCFTEVNFGLEFPNNRVGQNYLKMDMPPLPHPQPPTQTQHGQIELPQKPLLNLIRWFAALGTAARLVNFKSKVP